MADLRIVDAPEIPKENITGEEKLPTGGGGNYSISLGSLADYTKTKKDLADNASVDSKVNGVRQELDAHVVDLLNPHQVTKGQIGLDNVDNTADADKPVSNSTQAAIISAVSTKANKAYVDNQLTLKANKVDVYTKQESSDLVSNSISTALTPVNSSLDLAKRGVVNRYDSALTYNSDERIVLDNGDIVKSTIDGNANDPNTDMTGWVKTNSASQVFDETGRNQQQVNDGVASLDALRLINPKTKGISLYLNSVIEGKDLGGGIFLSTQKVGLVDNGGTIIASPNPALFWARINYENVIPQFWGALGDGVNDDRPAFQAAIDYLRNNGGGELLVPKPDVEYRWKSYDVANSACIVVDRPISSIYTDPISIRGIANLTRIKVELPSGTSIDSAVLFKNGGAYKRLENLSIWGGLTSTTPQVDYVVKGSDTFYPNMTVQDCQFYVAKKDCFRMATFVTLLSKLQTAYSPRGIVIAGPGLGETGNAVVTSITLNSCYALNHTNYGYWFGEATYCTFNSCASDHIINTTGDGVEAYPYYIDIARGVTLNGCGAESSTRILHCRAAQGLTINGLMTLSIGNATTPPNALIRLDGGSSTVIGGLWLQNPQGYTYKLSVGYTFARESVTVLDTSIAPKEYTFTNNTGRANPVLLLAYQKSLITRNLPLTNTGNATTNTTNMKAWAEYSYDLELVHTLTIQLPSGDFPINSAVFLTNAGTSGYARVVLKGNADGTSRIVCTATGAINFGVPNMLARMNYTLENVTIHADSTITAGTRPALFYNANVYFINSKLTSHNGAVQYATTSDSRLILDANSSIQTPVLTSGIVEYSYKATTPPTTSTRLPAGTIFKASDPNATRYAWINTTDNGATWLAMTP